MQKVTLYRGLQNIPIKMACVSMACYRLSVQKSNVDWFTDNLDHKMTAYTIKLVVVTLIDAPGCTKGST